MSLKVDTRKGIIVDIICGGHPSHIWTKNISFIRKRSYDYKILQPAVLCFTTAADDNLVTSPSDDPLRCRHRSQIFVFGDTEMDVLTGTWGWRWTAGGV